MPATDRHGTIRCGLIIGMRRVLMRLVVRLFLLALLVFLGGVVFIRYTYNCSWKESFAIADQFVSDLTG